MSAPPSPTLSDSELLDSLNDDPRFDLTLHREQRLEAIKREVDKLKSLQESEYGRVVTYGDEKQLIQRMAKEKYCLIHFFLPDFARCRIMDQKLEVGVELDPFIFAELAPKYPHTLFLRASVAHAPFLVDKFGVKVLPCVHVFVDGRGVDRLIGFEELGQTDQFTTAMLEFRLKQTGALTSGPLTLANHADPLLLEQERMGDGNDSDSDSDDDDMRERRKAASGVKAGARKGKTGIRNGLFSTGTDSDE